MKNRIFATIFLVFAAVLISTQASFSNESIEVDTAVISSSVPNWQSQNEIENKLYEFDGVIEVTFQDNGETIVVEFEPKKISSDELVYEINEMGFYAELVVNEK